MFITDDCDTEIMLSETFGQQQISFCAFSTTYSVGWDGCGILGMILIKQIS